jgi:hypothetical protein
VKEFTDGRNYQSKNVRINYILAFIIIGIIVTLLRI